MIKLKTTAFVLLILFAGCNRSAGQAGANPPVDTKAAIDIIHGFFVKYKNEGTNKALDFIFSKTPSITGLDNLKNRLDSARTNVLGDYVGYEPITQKNVAGSLVLFSYLVKHKNSPIRFTFIFYKPEKEWILHKFYFDTDFEDELESSGKIYFIK